MSSNTARIAKNTLMLYSRQIFIFLVSLYVVRLKLEILGVEDYGIYNVVFGLVFIFSFFNEAMATTTQRFLSFAIGQNDAEQIRDVFSVSFVIHILLSILVIILAETIGLWFFSTWLNIPQDRRAVAFTVYQLSIVTRALSILIIPYHATVVAHEKMSFVALISIIECLLKLLIIFPLKIIQFDKLVTYSFLFLFAEITVLLIYKFYCNRMFATAHFRYSNDRKLYKQITSFSVWSFFGNFSGTISSHGINILVNIFFGVTVNAAMGIATQVRNAVTQFLTNFQAAFKPQIVKSYAAEKYDYFMQLIFQTSKISFYLQFIFLLPLFINADFVIQLWLKNVPEYSIAFIRLMLLDSIIIAVSGPLVMSIQATGNIKRYQLTVSCLLFANLPLSYLFLRLGFYPTLVLIIKIGVDLLWFIWLIFFLNNKIKLPVIKFIKDVIVPILLITIISSLITLLPYYHFSGWTRLILSCLVSTLSICCLVYLIGLKKQERNSLHNWVKKLKKKNEYSF